MLLLPARSLWVKKTTENRWTQRQNTQTNAYNPQDALGHICSRQWWWCSYVLNEYICLHWLQFCCIPTPEHQCEVVHQKNMQDFYFYWMVEHNVCNSTQCSNCGTGSPINLNPVNFQNKKNHVLVGHFQLCKRNSYDFIFWLVLYNIKC